MFLTLFGSTDSLQILIFSEILRVTSLSVIQFHITISSLSLRTRGQRASSCLSLGRRLLSFLPGLNTVSHRS
jgi:hypothetical protein